MQQETCVFCRIAAGTIPVQRLYEDEDLVAFPDAQPVAPVHVLIIPKRHIASMEALEETDGDLVGRALLVAARLARELGVAEAGYRCVVNTHGDGGQSVLHLHLHLLGGKAWGWPPG